MTGSRYRGYTPLDIHNEEIRILTIESDARSELVNCSLRPVPLSQANPFYALSYVWGTKDNMQWIMLDGQRTSTRKNLRDFLHCLSTTLDGTLRVWVDYLCINQDDLDERSSQVSMMGRIYAAADSVYAWLGPSTLQSRQVYEFVTRAQDMRHAKVSYSKIYESDLTALDALNDIIDRQYWTRLWIIQEIVLAKRLWLFCGDSHIEWDDLPFVMAGRRPDLERSTSQSPKLLQYLKETRETKALLPYSELVHKFAAAQCQDERDKLYGLLALASADVRSRISIDYRKPLLQVLLETFEHWASGWTLEQGHQISATSTTNSFPPIPFCKQINILLSDSALLDLYDSPSKRARVSAKVILHARWQNERADFRPVAAVSIDGDALLPIIGGAAKTPDECAEGLVFQVIERSGRSTFAFTNIFVLPSDKVIQLGTLILIVRHVESGLLVVGRGIQQTCSPTERIFDPRIWLAQLLPDSAFEICPPAYSAKLGHQSLKRHDQHVDVQLNAAALVELLIGSRQQEYTWSPFEFGIEHGIVDLCTSCRLRLHSVRSRRMTTVQGSSCRCIWAGGDQALSAYWRSVRRHL